MKHYIARSVPLLFTHFYFVIALALACSMCKKPPKEPTVTGRVLEAGTNIPIPNARVKLIEKRAEFLGHTYSSITDSTLSDANGNYTLRYSDPKSVLYTQAYSPGYFSDTDSETHVPSRPADGVDIVLSPHAWIKVHLKNESGAYLIGVPGAISSDNSRDFTLSQGEDSTVVMFRKGNEDYKYVFSVLDTEDHVLEDISNIQINNGSIPIKKGLAALSFTFYLPGHDTTNISIKY